MLGKCFNLKPNGLKPFRLFFPNFLTRAGASSSTSATSGAPNTSTSGSRLSPSGPLPPIRASKYPPTCGEGQNSSSSKRFITAISSMRFQVTFSRGVFKLRFVTEFSHFKSHDFQSGYTNEEMIIFFAFYI